MSKRPLEALLWRSADWIRYWTDFKVFGKYPLEYIFFPWCRIRCQGGPPCYRPKCCDLSIRAEYDVRMDLLATDQSAMIQAYMRNTSPCPRSSTKRLKCIMKERGMLRKWIQSTGNHLWWCCATFNGNAVLLKEQWLSLQHHIVDEHFGFVCTGLGYVQICGAFFSFTCICVFCSPGATQYMECGMGLLALVLQLITTTTMAMLIKLKDCHSTKL